MVLTGTANPSRQRPIKKIDLTVAKSVPASGGKDEKIISRSQKGPVKQTSKKTREAQCEEDGKIRGSYDESPNQGKLSGGELMCENDKGLVDESNLENNVFLEPFSSKVDLLSQSSNAVIDALRSDLEKEKNLCAAAILRKKETRNLLLEANTRLDSSNAVIDALRSDLEKEKNLCAAAILREKETRNLLLEANTRLDSMKTRFSRALSDVRIQVLGGIDCKSQHPEPNLALNHASQEFQSACNDRSNVNSLEATLDLEENEYTTDTRAVSNVSSFSTNSTRVNSLVSVQIYSESKSNSQENIIEPEATLPYTFDDILMQTTLDSTDASPRKRRKYS